VCVNAGLHIKATGHKNGADEMNLKHKTLAAVFAVAVAGAALTGCDNHQSNAPAQQQQAPVAQQTAPAPAPVQAQPVVQPTVKKGDTPAEKQAKIDKLEGTDKARLESMGYKVLAAIGMGTANSDFTDLKDNGWHGNSTAIQYSILLNSGQHAKVVVEHHNFVPTVHNPVLLQ
jgi:hypothetical protein